MNVKTNLFLIVMLLLSFTIWAQEGTTVKGQILATADNLPMPGVNVIILGTAKGTSTDFDGNYELKVNKGDILQYSFVGYVTKTVTVDNQQTINVSLDEDASQLDEVVIIGYGTQRKSHLTGAISKVENKDLEQIAVTRVDDALVGKISGVNIQATDGEAGAAPTIRIRGTGSLAGSSDPLIVVDGLVVDNDYLGSLDMNDVESFEVLKDAASSAIYGSRAANGVIMITTKQGKEGKTVFTYNTYTGWKDARQSDDYYFSVAETAAAELAATGTLSDRTKYKQLIGVDNDWQNIIFNGGIIENHSFSARGGSEKTKYSATFGYLHDEGVLLTDDYKKYNLKLRLDTKVTDRLSFGVNIAPSYTSQRRFDGSTHDILRQAPWLPLYHDENTIQFVDSALYPNVKPGDYATQEHFDNYDLYGDGSSMVNISSTSNTNPGAKVLERNRTDDKFKMYGSFYGKYKIAKGLTFRASIAGDFQNTKRIRWQGIYASRNGADASQLDIESINRLHIVTDNYFNYDTTIGNHDISAILGFAAEKWDTSSEAARGTGYESDLIQTLSAAPTIASAESIEYQQRLMSYFGRFNYAYDNKYLVSLSLRADGSSVFGPENKYGYFPAASVGWIVSNEDFLSSSNVLSTLKLRFSYGVTGNTNLDTGDSLIDSYPYLALLNSSTAIVNDGAQSGYNPINIANPDLKWERSIEMNPGVDFGFFNNAVSGSIEYYKRTSDQLLLYNPIASTTGFTNALVNLGEVENSGFELEITTRNISREKFRWSTTLIASRNKNELVDFGDSNGQIQNVDDKRAAEWINLVGNPISSFYGWVVDHDIPSQYIVNPYHPIGGEAESVYVKDLNGDGVIDDDDKTILGNPYPDLVWSLSNDFKIGNFDFSFMVQGSHGAEVRNMGDQYLFNHFTSSQGFTSDTPNQEFIKEKIFTDDIVQDASYVALRNVNLGYNIPKEFISKTAVITKARVYVAGQNLMYFTADDYTGFNPESIDDTSGTTYGYQRAGKPIFSTISLGLNLEF
ncbi:SusC/RagA family TonB-linked outer membrane protein [Bizionia sp. KMM 8389]